MSKNTILATIVAAALLSSTGALAANVANDEGEFTATFVATDDITISGLEDVTIEASDVGSDGYVHERTPYCVGRRVNGNNPLGYEITVDTKNRLMGGKYALRQNGSEEGASLLYQLHHTTKDKFHSKKEITPNSSIEGKTRQSIGKCNHNGRDINGYVWVSVAKKDMEEVSAGTYSDTITLRVTAI